MPELAVGQSHDVQVAVAHAAHGYIGDIIERA